MMFVVVTPFMIQRLKEDDTHKDVREASARYVQVPAELGGPAPVGTDAY